MKVVLADGAGACYGVRRALRLANEAAQKSDHVYTFGPLIHNPQVVSQLAEQGVVEVDSIEQIPPHAVAVIRSHGVTPAVMRSIREAADHVVDATCPHVTRAQVSAAELAREDGCVIVVGEAGHPEVEGLVACASEEGARVIVALSGDELPDDVYEPVGIVVQTTQTHEALASVVDELERRNIHADVKDTICDATRQRQEAAATLASNADAIVVIGGRNSANTTRLAEICSAACPNTHHIETIEEIDPAWFEGCELVGVSAGASTPEDQTDAVMAYLESL